jgi:hypothetical protein
MHKDTVRDDDTMLTERYLVTLKRDPGKETWKVASEDLQDSYSNLYRLKASGDFQKFTSLNLAREGLTVTGGAGQLFKVTRAGKVSYIVLTAANLGYAYVPPEANQKALWEKLKKDNNARRRLQARLGAHRVRPGLVRPDPGLVVPGIDDTGSRKMDETGPAPTDDPVLRDRFDEGVKNFKKFRRENPFSGFERPGAGGPPYLRRHDLQEQPGPPARPVLRQLGAARSPVLGLQPGQGLPLLRADLQLLLRGDDEERGQPVRPGKA